MSSTASKFSSAIVSALAMAALAAIPLGISIYMFAIMGAGKVASPSMIFLAVALGFVGVGLAIGCVYCLWWAFTKSAKKDDDEREDDSWKDMPFPKG